MPVPKFIPPLTPCNLPVARCPVPRAQATQRILVMRCGGLGDILMGTPLLAALRRAYPHAHLTWIAEHTNVQAIDASPYIDEVLCWDGRHFKRPWRQFNLPLWAARALALGRALRRRRYDIFISFQPEEWPLLMRATGAPVRVGVFDTFLRFYGGVRKPQYRRLYTHVYGEPGLPAHRADQYLLPLEALGVPPASRQMSLGFTREDAQAAQEALARRGLRPGERFVVLAPTTTWPTKNWPAERYAALGDALARRHGCRIVMTGAPGEREHIEAVAARMAAPPLLTAGVLTFRETAALLSRASLVVSGDTGPMHAAAALGTPQIALFGPTSPAWYGPRAVPGRARALTHPVPCAPCDRKSCPNTGDDHLRCLRLLGVDEVLEAARPLLAGVP